MNPIVVTLSVLIMVPVMLIRRKLLDTSLLKTAIIFIELAIVGYFSTALMSFIETGKWGGIRFFGAVLFLPILFAPIAFVTRIPLSKMLDTIAFPGMMIFAVMKFNCYLSGCCGGRVLWTEANGAPVCFPSQIVEGITTALLVVVLMILERKKNMSGRIFPIAMLTYGILRFGLHLLREPEGPYILGMQAGIFWSILSIVIGATWLLVLYYKKVDKQYQEFISQQQK